MKRVVLCVLFCAATARAESKERIAAIVNGQPILLSDVEDRVGPELVWLLQQAPGPQRDKERAALLHRGLTEMVDEKLTESEATSLGLSVTEDELRRALEQLAQQQGMKLADFRQALEQQGISWDTVRDTVRRQTLMAQVLRYKVKRRTVSDEEVRARYAELLQRPQYEVRARHLFVPVPPNATPAQQAAAHAKAEQALSRVKAGETFALVAREMSEGHAAEQGGDLGYFRRGLMLPAIEQAAFALNPGEVSLVIRTGSGFHIVLVEDRRLIPPKPLDEVKEEIRSQLASESVSKERENYLGTLRKTAQIDQKL
ncbi:MAG TPA: peptidylprolyl isomerase [Myxococcales bacterium]|nr:peptidylprolyl isomerase [Myxococcales bacterium]